MCYTDNMKLTQIDEGKIKVLHNLVGFKWLKTTKTSKKSLIELPDSVMDTSQSRLGNKYLCQAIAVGPKVTEIISGDRFYLHEYSKSDQGTPWDDSEIMFCEEKDILFKVDRDHEGFSLAGAITKDLEDHYEANEEVQQTLGGRL